MGDGLVDVPFRKSSFSVYLVTCVEIGVRDGLVRVRDTKDLIELGLPVFSGSVCIKGTVKETIGPINHPLVFGGEIVYPGDVLLGDADGVVVVRKDEIEEVIKLSQARVDAEDDLIRRYKEGGTTIELCKLTEVLTAKGLLVEDAELEPAL